MPMPSRRHGYATEPKEAPGLAEANGGRNAGELEQPFQLALRQSRRLEAPHIPASAAA
ncbi:hypothetical protein X753_14060 [Mesorhizobium sp. LNJC399B00]|nr:hypothetical protein X753_14060 [Mesorhizobium sp. LNJC399B00]